MSKLGFIKHACFDPEQRRTTFKCPNSTLEYETLDLKVRDQKTLEISIYGFHVSKLCPNDPGSYQTCGHFDQNLASKNSNILCGGYLKNMCDDFYAENFEDTIYKYMECDMNCSDNGDCLAPPYSEEEEFVNVCDDKCDDDFYCADESNCNGYSYGANCRWQDERSNTTLHSYAPVAFVCTEGVTGNKIYSQGCSPGLVENDCNIDSATSHTCYHYVAKIQRNEWVKVPLLNYTRCTKIDFKYDGLPYCWDFLDQTNCSDVKRVGGQCFVNGFMSSISKYVVCDSETYEPQFRWQVELCDNGLEHSCIFPIGDSGCRIHKHKTCNGEFDCINKEDEYNDFCSFLTLEFVCERQFLLNVQLPIPLSWIMDGVRDCISGEDEDSSRWSFCGKEEKFRRVKQLNETCRDVFICPGDNTTFVKFYNLCDGVESCGMENEVCWIARDFPIIQTVAPREGSLIDLCEELEIPLGESCDLQTFNRGSTHIFGVENLITLRLPNFRVSCAATFGEYYVYFSCSGVCLEPAAQCPLNNKPLLHDSCPGQFPDRIYTLANNSYLTFVRESNGGYYYKNYFQCENKNCIEYDKMCNLVDDCADGSDEKNCSNHFVCQDTVNKSKKHLISIEQKCDGIYDCFDFSDECNSQCGREIFENWILKLVSWTIGILAIAFNLVTSYRGLLTLKKCDSDAMLMNQSLANVITCGDLLTGLNLTVLSVYDSFVYQENFCKFQADWLTSTTCSVLGVISTLGSQLSLFAMTVLSFIRASGLIRKQFQRPSDVNRKAVIKTIAVVSGIFFVSLAIALTPLIHFLEEYFVQGMYYDPEYKVFIGFPDKRRHLQILKSYFNSGRNSENHSTVIKETISWREIGIKIDMMFTADYGRLRRTPVHFYGNDGVCLFKYFIRSDDARRSRNTSNLNNVSDITDHKGHLIVWLMLGLNFVCVMAISVCYLLIIIFVRKSSANSGSNQCSHTEKRMNSMQKKIAMIIITDFLSWIPFILASALHNLKVIDATNWYIIFAVLILPINSCINPLIYDNQLGGFVLSVFRKIRQFVNVKNFMPFVRKKENDGHINNDIKLQDIQKP